MIPCHQVRQRPASSAKVIERSSLLVVCARQTAGRTGTCVVQGNDLGRGGEPALLVHAHALVVARPEAVSLHPVLGHASAQLQRLQLLLVWRMVSPARQLLRILARGNWYFGLSGSAATAGFVLLRGCISECHSSLHQPCLSRTTPLTLSGQILHGPQYMTAISIYLCLRLLQL